MLGLVLWCFVSAANVADVKAAPVVLVPALENNPRLLKNLADQTYRGAIRVLLQMAYDCTLELTQKLGQGNAPSRTVAVGSGDSICMARKCTTFMSRL